MSEEDVFQINDVNDESILVIPVEEDVILVNEVTEENILVNLVEESVTIIDNLTEVPIGTIGIPVEEKGVPSGVATLDENGKVPLTQLPDLGIDVDQIKSDVEQWIDDATSPKADKLTVDQQLSGKVDLTQYQDELLALSQSKADKTEVNRLIDDANSVKANQSDLVILESLKANKTDVDQQLNEKLDRSEYQQHFRGVFATVESLISQVLNPVAGDYANVDGGVGVTTQIYAYDVDDNKWESQGSNGISVSSTDSVPEGNNNIYHTSERVKSVVKTMSTTDLPEGVNKYYTEERVISVVNLLLSPIQNQIGEIDILLDELLG